MSLIIMVLYWWIFETINYDILIVKLHAYGFGKNVLDLVNRYLKIRKKRVKINTTFSTWTAPISGVPRRSVLGLLFFNIYLNDLIYFGDDTTPFACDETLESVLDKLEGNSKNAIFWFENNYIKPKTDKCHLLVFVAKYKHSCTKIGNEKIWGSNEVKLVGVKVDEKFKYGSHIANICFKANQKLSVLSRSVSLLTFDKKRILVKHFFNLNLSIVLWLGCIVTEWPTTELINYLSEP